MVTKIYILKDETGRIRYVGRTINPLGIRLSQHLSKARHGDTSHRGNWIRAVFSRGFVPSICLLGEVSGTGADEEAAWIKYFRDDGLDLVNATDGGEGCPGLTFSAEALAKIGTASKGRLCSVETRKRISEALRKRDPAVAKRISETMRKVRAEKGFSAETRHKISEGLRRYNASPAAKSKVVSKETREKISRQVRSRGPDWHDKLSAAQIASHARRRKLLDNTSGDS